MRYVGMILIVLAGCGLGLTFSRRLYRRVWLLARAERLLQALDARLLYTAEPLSKLWRQLAESPAFADDKLLQETVRGLSDAPFSEAFSRAADRLGPALTADDRALLKAFGEGCGVTGLQEQTAHIRQYVGELRRAREGAEAVAAERGRLYRVAGLSGGLALALLLF